MSWGLVIAAGVGAGATLGAGAMSKSAAEKEGNRLDAAEQQRFEEAKAQAERLRQQGKESEAVAVEEALRAELGAQKFEAASKAFADYYANQANDNAMRKEQAATELYSDINAQAKAREAAGVESSGRIRDAGQGVVDAAERSGRLQTDALGNIKQRYSPFLSSEASARGQMDVELGLSEGDTYTGYRGSPAYMAAQDASRVAEQDAKDNINQAAGNSGTLYSGTRGAALVDRGTRGSYERAGIEQSYYQNYLNMLQSAANPTATNAVSNFEANTAANTGAGYMNAAGTNLNATTTAENARLGTMRTGEEGAYLIDAMRTGTEGAPYAMTGLNGMDLGTAGSPYRMAGTDYRFRGEGGAGQTTMNYMPTGVGGANARLEGVSAQGAAVADAVGGATNLYSTYLRYGQPSNKTTADQNQWSSFYGA